MCHGDDDYDLEAVMDFGVLIRMNNGDVVALMSDDGESIQQFGDPEEAEIVMLDHILSNQHWIIVPLPD